MRFAPTSNEQTLMNDLSLEERFHYATTRICECEEVWSLGDDNGWLIRDVDDKAVISIWPYRQMAQQSAETGEDKNIPICVSLEHFLYTLLKQCQENEIVMEVNPAPASMGFLIPAAQLYEVLENMVETETYFIEG